MPCIRKATLLRGKKKVYRAVVFEEKDAFQIFNALIDLRI